MSRGIIPLPGAVDNGKNVLNRKGGDGTDKVDSMATALIGLVDPEDAQHQLIIWTHNAEARYLLKWHIV